MIQMRTCFAFASPSDSSAYTHTFPAWKSGKCARQHASSVGAWSTRTLSMAELFVTELANCQNVVREQENKLHSSVSMVTSKDFGTLGKVGKRCVRKIADDSSALEILLILWMTEGGSSLAFIAWDSLTTWNPWNKLHLLKLMKWTFYKSFRIIYSIYFATRNSQASQRDLSRVAIE